MSFGARLQWACALLVLVAAETRGQSTLGKIVGSVRDTSGASVPNARLSLRNLDENTVTVVASSPVGSYEFLNLKPGRYSITAERTGFTSATTSEILLNARETREADLTLQVAGKTEAIVIIARVPLVNTTDGTISDSKSFEEITKLPLNFRAGTKFDSNSPLAATLTVPGIQSDPYHNLLSLSGGMPGQVDITIDGISVTDVSLNLANSGMTPSAEMLGEFKVTSVDNSAEFGQMGDISMVSRAGTDQWHGSAFWYWQNRVLNANIYGSPFAKPGAVYNAFGGSFSGPLALESVDRGHDRTFFFVDYEGKRLPSPILDQAIVPTASMRAGDLRGVPGPAAVDPRNSQPFPNQRIPLTRINSVATNLFDGYYPLPNSNGVNNYLHLTHAFTNSDGYDIRLDHLINSKQHLYGRWTEKLASSLRDNLLLPPDTVDLSYHNFVLSHTYTLRDSLSNEVRFGFTRTTTLNQLPFSGRDAVASLGLTGLNLTNVGNTGGFPLFVFADQTFAPIGHGRPTDNNSRIFQYADALSWVHGKHTMKYGAELRHLGYHSTLHGGNGADDYGAIIFSPRTFSGSAFADLLLGLPAISYYNTLGPNVDESALTTALYAEDSWRVHPRLTLQFGLRWELHPPFKEANGNIANFDHQSGNVIIPDNSLPQSPSFLQAINACPITQSQPCTAILTASQVGLGQGLRRTYFSDWNPRLGFAWQPWSNGKTVIRGGIGRYTQSLLGSFAYGPTGLATSDIRTYVNYQGPGLPPLFTFPNVSPPLSSVGKLALESFGPGVDPNFRDPYSFQWNFTVERELPWSTILRASYIGVQSVGMPAMVEYNQVPASVTPWSQARTPFPLWANLYSQDALGFSNYQGMHLELSHRLRNDLFFQASYVLAKNLGADGALGFLGFPTEAYGLPFVSDRFNTRYDRGNLPGVRRNTVLLTGLVPLPFGKGRAFGSNWRGVKQGAFGGWELSTVSVIESGPYQTPTISGNLDQSNTGINTVRFIAVRPDRIGNGNLASPTPQRYYDIAAFAPVPQGAGRFGNAGLGILRGPGTIAIAGGLAKTFQISEKIRLRTEATFTNLPNHPNFLPPQVNVSNPSAFGKLTAVQSLLSSGNRSGQLAARLEF